METERSIRPEVSQKAPRLLNVFVLVTSTLNNEESSRWFFIFVAYAYDLGLDDPAQKYAKSKILPKVVVNSW